MKISSREFVLILIAGTAILFGGFAILAKPKIDEWKELREKQTILIREIKRNQAIVNQKDNLATQFEELSQKLPLYPLDKKMDIYWLSIMDSLASKSGVIISKRQAGKEKQEGDVYELPIECREWTADLDSLTHFLFDLQSKGAMLDVRQLLVKPKARGLLRGRFSLYCAYTRSDQKIKL